MIKIFAQKSFNDVIEMNLLTYKGTITIFECVTWVSFELGF